SVAHRTGAISGKAVEPPSHKVTPRVAAERVAGEQRRIDQEDHAARPDSELPLAEEGTKSVVVQDEDEGDCEIERVPVQVLDDQEPCFAPVPALRDRSDRAAGRRAEERPVIRLAVVVTGGSESTRENEDQESGRCRQEGGPPGRPGAEPG